ncbi:aminoglycoside N(3)-acetyltransferase [Levilactobacillus fujinensis]|uniref:Aminoglycoside N(3)-acetyltransferase n=2 Tax=Levilactobacillus fujinensis TaxID=2486024 RepID=A0ABW1TGJ2_9LACO|nr:AAC(3) family N-acetyltransferase [Levilactobacillus fujinensis]
MTQDWKATPITTVMTGTELAADLRELGLTATDSCLVHTRLSAFGFIPGGEQTVVRTLQTVLNQGNIAMPAQSADYSDPRGWLYPPVQKDLQAKVVAGLPGYDPQTTPIHYIGLTPEYFRNQPGVHRSGHPTCSLTAWGRDAKLICETTTYDLPFGVNSPLQKLYDLDAKVVCLGTDFESCTAIHLAESQLARPRFQESAPVLVDGQTKWVDYTAVELEPYDDFNEMGTKFMAANQDKIHEVTLANGTVLRSFSLRGIVDFALAYYRQKDAEKGGILYELA